MTDQPTPRPTEPWVKIVLSTGEHEWWPERMTFAQVAEVRAVTKRSTDSIVDEAFRDPGFDTAVTVAWISRRMAGEPVSLLEVAAGMRAADYLRVERRCLPIPSPEEAAEHPEA